MQKSIVLFSLMLTTRLARNLVNREYKSLPFQMVCSTNKNLTGRILRRSQHVYILNKRHRYHRTEMHKNLMRLDSTTLVNSLFTTTATTTLYKSIILHHINTKSIEHQKILRYIMCGMLKFKRLSFSCD